MHPSHAPSQAVLRLDRTSPAQPLLRGRTLVLARAVWLGVVTLALIIFAVAIMHQLSVPGSIRGWSAAALQVALSQLGLSLGFYSAYRFVMEFVTALGFVVVGLWLFWRRSSEWMVLVVSLFLVTFGVNWFSDDLPELLPNWALPVALLDFIAGNCFGLFFALFPDGRFVPRWIRELWIGGVVYTLLLLIGPLPQWLNLTSFVAAFGAATAIQIYRYRHVSGPLQRQQAKWLAFGVTVIFAVIGALIGLSLLFPSLDQPGSAALLYQMVASLLLTLAFLLIPLSIAIAVLRYQLWNIDILINRTLVYGTLTASVVVVYALVVGLFGALFQSQGNVLVELLATGLVAMLFQPLRDRLQHGINRLMYGDRDDPYRVVVRLGQRLEAAFETSAILPAIVQTVSEALKLPYVAIALAQNNSWDIVAATGTPPSDEPLRLPLTYQSTTVGQLLISPRHGETTLSAVDRRLLGDLAQQAGGAVHGVRLMTELHRLTTDLQHSRERLVLAREEERRRLRRDLHDDLAPTLAGLSLTASTISDLIPRDPARAVALTTDLQTAIRSAVSNIRRLVYDLRPSALDELGLAAAIRERAAQHNDHRGAVGGLQVVVAAPDHFPPLPAAVEVAAYRIVQEALMNVVRHAQARTCSIRISVTEALHLEITDDGVGLADTRTPGVGLRSMYERAAELGGSCAIEPMPGGGTRVCISLPIVEDKADEYASHLDR
jgi:signal transduction histidine kinase